MGMKAAAQIAACLLAVAIVGCGSSANDTAGDQGSNGATGDRSTDGGTSKPASKGSAGAHASKGDAGDAGGGASADAGADANAAGAGGVQHAGAVYPDPRGACDIDSGFPSDDACILPPPPDEGFQIHIGPSDYNDPDQINTFLIKAGQEVESCWTFHTPNDEPIYYQTWVLSARDGTHHIINTMYDAEIADGGFTPCADPGTGTNSTIIENLPGASKPYMPRMPVAPENAHVGRMIGANTTSQADMHNFNPTDKDTLREFWLNIYYVDKAQITDETKQIRVFGGLGWNFAPIPLGTDKTYSYSCPIPADGRIIGLLGHIHSHATYESASIQRADGQVEKVFEMYDYLDPAEFTYDSVTMNPTFSASAPGATSGPIQVHAGDALLWSCHVINNDVPGGLRFINEVINGEMCIMWGAAVGPEVSCNLQ